MPQLPHRVPVIPQNFPQIAQAFFFDQISSTNEEALSLGKSFSHNALVVADSQSQGRGRLGRKWDSAPGLGLYLSLLFRPRFEIQKLVLLTLASGLALKDALENLGIPELWVKWPNDLWFRDQKLAGILAESLWKDSHLDFTVLGIGLNVHHDAEDFPLELQKTATSLKLIDAQSWDRGLILENILREFFAAMERLERESPEDFAFRWNRDSGMRGRAVQVEDQRGVVQGINAQGQLELLTDAGQLLSLVSEEILIL